LISSIRCYLPSIAGQEGEESHDPTAINEIFHASQEHRVNQRFKSNEVEEFAFDHLSLIETGGLLSRRELMRRAGLFGAASTLGTFTGILHAAGPEAAGKVTVGLDSGAFTPILKTFAPEFQKATGIDLTFASYPLGNMYDQNLLALRQKTARFDAFDFWPNFVGDFGPYLTPLEEVGTKAELGFDDIAPPFQLLNHYEGKLVGVTIDGDMFMNTLRTDLFEDPAEAKAFKAKYGYDLAAPRDYKQYRDTAEFFTRPDKNLYGAVEVTSYFVYAFFINHLVQAAVEKGQSRYGELFDADMKPQLLTDVAEEALRRYGEMTAFMPKNLAKAMPWDVGRQMFFEGKIAQANWWTDMPKGAADPSISKVAGKIKCAANWGGHRAALWARHGHRQELAEQEGRVQGHCLDAANGQRQPLGGRDVLAVADGPVAHEHV